MKLPKELADSNSRFVEPARGVMLGCMDPVARDLMDCALEKYAEHCREIRHHTKKNHRGSVYSFAYWLFRWSGLIDASGKARNSNKAEPK